MIKKILIPTDGSDFSTSVALAGVEFSRQIGAEIVGLFVAAEFQNPVYVEVQPANYPSESEYQESMRKAGEAFLKIIQNASHAAGLDYSSLIIFSDLTAAKISQTAHDMECDLIFMGSHGRSGWGQLLLGSVTAKVLSGCEIPVLVQRIKEPRK